MCFLLDSVPVVWKQKTKQTNKVGSSSKTFPHEVLNTYLKHKVGTESSISHRFFSFPVCCCFQLFTLHHHTKSSLWIHIVQGTINGHPISQELSNNSHLPPWCLPKRQQASTGVIWVFWSLNDWDMVLLGICLIWVDLSVCEPPLYRNLCSIVFYLWPCSMIDFHV